MPKKTASPVTKAGSSSPLTSQDASARAVPVPNVGAVAPHPGLPFTPPASPIVATTPPAHSLSTLLGSQESANALPAHPLEAAMTGSKPSTPLSSRSASLAAGFSTALLANPQTFVPSHANFVTPHTASAMASPAMPTLSLPCPPPTEIPAVGFSGTVSVVNINSPSSFHVILSPEMSGDLQRLVAEAIPPLLSAPRDDFHPVRGSYCLAPFLDSYHRAVVLEVVEGCRQVLFIDFGNRELLQDCLLPLPHELSSIPCQAIHCQLDGVVPRPGQEKVWSYQSACAFSDLAMEKEVEMTVKVSTPWRHSLS